MSQAFPSRKHGCGCDRHHRIRDDDDSTSSATEQRDNQLNVPRKRQRNSDSGPCLIYTLSGDVFAHCLSFLVPTEVHELLTVPISRQWREAFTLPQELWKSLCISDPFNASPVEGADEEEYGSGDDDFPGTYRRMYASFAECADYLRVVEVNALEKRAAWHDSLQKIDAFGTHVSVARATVGGGASASLSSSSSSGSLRSSDKRQTSKTKESQASGGGKAPPVIEPYSCAIISVMNWIAAFPDVPGIQIMCLKVLPPLLEDDRRRKRTNSIKILSALLITLQRHPLNARVAIHTFHALVFLSRPMGGKEGQMIKNPTDTLYHPEFSSGRGFQVLLDAMRRFADDARVQAYGCWSLVNLALVEQHRQFILRFGGLDIILEAMGRYSRDEDVQFRGLFALINLVSTVVDDPFKDKERTDSSLNTKSCGEILSESIPQIASLSVAAMTNFRSSPVILNRSVHVIHNLSLKREYHAILEVTPQLRLMLCWIVETQKHDRWMWKSAGLALRRLQYMTHA